MAGANTITTVKKDSGVFTIAEINALFTDIATALNAKVDTDQTVALTAALVLDGIAEVINVPYPEDDSDAVPLNAVEDYL